MLTGFVGIAYYSKQGLNLANPETVFIELSEILFHPIITGFFAGGTSGSNYEHNFFTASCYFKCVD
ncbi:hypothetical protein GCM10020331_015290 [Ectobacillus funiculus]